MKRKTLAKKTIELTKPVFKVNFTETEIALISMLIAKSKTGLTASITEINYILGVKDKNIGMQKKVRSDIFKSINDKFNIFSNSDEILIKSIRSESDKRYYEYMIDKETIESISAFLDPEIQLK
jgi:transcriptional antiterminator